MALLDINYDNLTGEEIKNYLEYFKECRKISPLTPEEEGQNKLLTELFVIGKYKEERDNKLRLTTDKFNNVESMRDYLYCQSFGECVKDSEGNYSLSSNSPLLGKTVNMKLLDGIYRVPVTTFNKKMSYDMYETEDKLSDLLGDKFDEKTKKEYEEISDINSHEYIFARFDHNKPTVVTEVISKKEIPLYIEEGEEKEKKSLDDIFKGPFKIGVQDESGNIEPYEFNTFAEFREFFIKHFGMEAYKKYEDGLKKELGLDKEEPQKSELQIVVDIANVPSFSAYVSLTDGPVRFFDAEKLENMDDPEFSNYIRMNEKHEMIMRLNLLEKTGLKEKCEFVFEHLDVNRDEIEQEYINKVIRFKNK